MRKMIFRFLLLRKSEQRGLLLALSILFLSLILRTAVTIPRDEPLSLFNDSMALFMEKFTGHEKKMKENEIHAQPFSLHSFDPNTVSEEELLGMGIPARIAGNLVRYRRAGGRFREPSGLRKIYGMSDSLWALLEPHIHLTEAAVSYAGESVVYGKHSASDLEGDQFSPSDLAVEPGRKLVDAAAPLSINRATPEMLDSLPGVPTFLAERIVKYRNLLGGFSNPEQLMEVYGMDSSLAEKVMDHAVFDTSLICRINVNTATAGMLARHPYIDYRIASRIVHYRDFAGHISGLSELSGAASIPEDRMARIAPYLTCDSLGEISSKSID
jgi:competence ComEA-like helix-hairpin-helix protein